MIPAGLSPLFHLLRCIECGGAVELAEVAPTPAYPELGPDGILVCSRCGERYPLIAGTPRMLPRSLRGDLSALYPDATLALTACEGGRASTGREAEVKQRTARSFAYEWRQFGELRDEWRRNFDEYLKPHPPAFFEDLLMLDVGAGSGRHSHVAARLGARVVAVDLGQAIDVARRNLPDDALTVQADAERLPFDPETFDFVMSIGVLHHLPDPERALRSLVPYVAPAGRLHVYLYWVPEARSHRVVLRAVSALRRVTVRMPHRLLHLLCYPIAAVLQVAVVLPYRVLRRARRLERIAARFPLQTYANYPFAVLVNDQFDRFSAPIERRYTRREVEDMFRRAGLTAVEVRPNYGWVASGSPRAAVRTEGS